MTDSQRQHVLAEAVAYFFGTMQPVACEGLALYGEAEEEAPVPGEARVFTMANETGSGRISVYPVFEGIALYYNDLHLAYCNQHQPTAKNAIEINHCRVGRFECSFGENSCCYVGSGDLAIGALSRKKSHTQFPLNHYHGISIYLNFDAIQPQVAEIMALLGIDLAQIRRTICEGNRCLIMRADEKIEHIFGELYNARAYRKSGYRKIKMLELLLFLSDLDVAAESQQTAYFSREQVARIKAVAAWMTEDLTRHATLEQLAARFGLSVTALTKGFRDVYGTSVYAYLRLFRLETARKLLLETALPVTEIAGRVGYENPNKFSSAFKKVYGLSPTMFRQRVQMDRSPMVWSGEEV